MWKNKHVVVALLVTPVLALIGYFAVDYMVSERPHAARAGESYPLVAKPNCRYDSGECDLVNGDVKLNLTADRSAGGTRLLLKSELALQEAMVAVAHSASEDSPPVEFVADDGSALSWSTDIGDVATDEASLRVVVVAGESRYFAEIPTVFFEHEPFGTR